MHQTVLFSSAAVVPQSKSTRYEARRHHFIMICDIFGNRTNKRDQPTVAPLQVTEINTLNQITGKVIDVSRTHIPLKALMIPLKRVKLGGVV